MIRYTPGGYRQDEVVSALQKCIRRGMELEAAYWAVELATRYYKYVWWRLETVAHEDVGLADPFAAVYIATCKEQYLSPRAEGKDQTLALINAAVYLARAPKSRLSDEVYAILAKEKFQIEIPDFALDQHTYRGRNMGRGWDHLITDGIHLENEHPDESLHKYRQLWLTEYQQKPYKAWYNELVDKLNGKSGPDKGFTEQQQLDLGIGD